MLWHNSTICEALDLPNSTLALPVTCKLLGPFLCCFRSFALSLDRETTNFQPCCQAVIWLLHHESLSLLRPPCLASASSCAAVQHSTTGVPMFPLVKKHLATTYCIMLVFGPLKPCGPSSSAFCYRILDNLPVAIARFSADADDKPKMTYERGFPVGFTSAIEVGCIHSARPCQHLPKGCTATVHLLFMVLWSCLCHGSDSEHQQPDQLQIPICSRSVHETVHSAPMCLGPQRRPMPFRREERTISSCTTIYALPSSST
jgi:hypothetical protein